MDLFKRRKPDNPPEEETPRDDLSAEATRLQASVRECEVQIREADARLATVRSEYTATVSNLMKIKKEINDMREERERLERQSTNIVMQIEEGRKILKGSHRDLDLAEKAAADLEKIRSELDSTTQECRREQSRLNKIRRALADTTGEVARRSRENESLAREREGLDAKLVNATAGAGSPGVSADTAGGEGDGGAGSELDRYRSRLAETDAERRKMRAQLAERDETIQDLRRRLAEAELEKSGSDQDLAAPQSDKGVIEAASALVGSYRTRLAKAEQDLADARRDLAEERERHAKTSKKLKALKGKDQAGK